MDWGRLWAARGCSEMVFKKVKSQPELGANQIVRFVTKQAPAPQAKKFGGGAREGEEGRVLY